MAGQPVGGVHINQLLSNLAVLYQPDPAQFIADQVCPYIPVEHESDLYPVFGQGDFYSTQEDDEVPDRSEARRVEFSHTTATFQCVRRAFAWDVSDRELGNADAALRLEANKQIGTLGRLMLKREARVAALLRKTTNSGQLALGVTGPTANWQTSSTTYTQIMTDIIVGKAAIRAAIGLYPNVIIIPAQVAEGMQKSAFFQAIQYTATREELVSEAYPVIPPVISGMKVLIPPMISNTAAEGLTASYSDIWGAHVRLLYVTDGPDLYNPSVAYTMRHEPLTTRQWREEARRVTAYETGQTITETVVSASAGYEITNAVS